LHCPPREEFKKRHGCRSFLFLTLEGVLLRLWDLTFFVRVLPWRRVGEIERPKPDSAWCLMMIGRGRKAQISFFLSAELGH
jgi:hypothetical protein